jgi:hypothetical protein
MIVDCYCEVCGSPAGAVPYAPAMTAASALDDEAPTQPIPRVTMPAQQSTQVPAEPVVADPAAVDAKKVGREKGLTENEIDAAQDYRTRVEEAQLPDDVRKAVLYEVAKLERTSDQSPEADDIRNWLDTMLDLPWSTEISDSIDIEGSRDIEATLRGLIKPAVADVEEGDTGEVEPVATDLEEGDTAEVYPAEVDTMNLDREKALAGNEVDGFQGIDGHVEEAQLPDEVRLAALREVGMLERTSDQSPESDDIRNGLDTTLEVPWSTEIMDSIDIEESRDVEATLRGLIKPAVANEEGDPAEVEPLVGDVEQVDAAEVGPLVGDLEQGDTADVGPLVADVGQVDTGEVEPAVADVEQIDPAETEPAVADVEQVDTGEAGPLVADVERVDRAPAGPHDDDTVQMPAVLAGFSGSEHPSPQLPEQQVVGPVLVETPKKKRRSRSLVLAATATLVLLLIGALFLATDRDRGVTAQSAPTVTAAATTVSEPTNEPSDQSTGAGAASPIQLRDLPESGRASQTVQIKGRFRGGPDTFLRVQRWEGGKWLDYPLITKTDKAGRFTAYVEPGGPGRYQLRVLDPNSLVTSDPFVLVIKR